MKIEERMRRNDIEDKIYIGEIVEQATSGEFGAVLRCIIEGLKDIELQKSKISEADANRVLGRLEAYNQIQNELDTCIETKNKLKEEIKEEHKINAAPQGFKL